MHSRVAPAERIRVVTLPDQRVLAWSEWGPSDGTPVLFCTGAGMSGSLGFGADAVHELGVRLLAVDRPGLGRSSLHPDKSLDSWAEDIRELVSAEDLHDVTTVGFSQGAPFALALGGSGIASCVAVVAGQDDLGHDALRAQLHPEVAAMVDAARSDPAGFEQQLARTADAAGLWQLVVTMSSDRDKEFYASGTLGDAYLRSVQEGFSHGAAGYARDLVTVLRPWPVAPEHMRVPVDLWYGQLDTSPVHSPDFGATLATRLPAATRTVLPDEGSSLLWTHARDILRHLTKRTDIP